MGGDNLLTLLTGTAWEEGKREKERLRGGNSEKQLEVRYQDKKEGQFTDKQTRMKLESPVFGPS